MKQLDLIADPDFGGATLNIGNGNIETEIRGIACELDLRDLHIELRNSD